MARSGGIDKRAIAKIAKDMQREFDKHPIRIPLQTDGPQGLSASGRGAVSVGGTVINIQGSADGAVLTFGGGMTQNVSTHVERPITTGYEPISQAVLRTLEGLPGLGLPAEQEQDARIAGEEVLAEVVEPEPDDGKIRRLAAALRGYLSPVATGLSQGAGEGAQEWAKTAVEQLGTPF